MKLKRMMAVAVLLCMVFAMLPGLAGAAEGEVTPMYRLYNPNSGEHFYTGSAQERDDLVKVGWNYEGVAWNAPIYSGEPVYRVFNPNSGDHHYTMSWEEVEMLVELGWQYEGVCWNSASSDGVPQYRLYNPNADLGSHHYTSSVEERENLVSLGWILEGIGWFGTLPEGHEHSYTSKVTAPTCTENGYTLWYCSCGQSYTAEEQLALGHDYEVTVTVPTCTADGYTTCTCDCGDSYSSDYVDAFGHSYMTETVKPTTSAQGYDLHTCVWCGDSYQDNYTEKLPEPGSEGILFISWPKTASRNETATVEIQGKPNTKYSITVYYKSGASTADGLEAKNSDSNGYVSWSWQIGGKTSPGTFRIVVSGGGETETVYFTIE